MSSATSRLSVRELCPKAKHLDQEYREVMVAMVGMELLLDLMELLKDMDMEAMVEAMVATAMAMAHIPNLDLTVPQSMMVMVAVVVEEHMVDMIKCLALEPMVPKGLPPPMVRTHAILAQIARITPTAGE